jgi:hypothetical protein
MRRNAVALLVIFIVTLACFALLSRAVSTVGVANIKVETARSQIITHEIRVEAVLSSLSDKAAGYMLEATIPAADARELLAKDVVAAVTLADGTQVDGLPLLARLSEDGSTVVVQAVMPQGDAPYVEGSRVQIGIVVASAEYQKCLPAESIYAEGSQYYVYVVTEVSSLTGTELGVQKVYVTVLDSNQVVTAVEDSSVSAEQRVVVQSDRILNQDTRVRIAE